MPVIDGVKKLKKEMTAWRRDLHAHPELGFKEERTADIVADKLTSFGIPIHRGLATTGVIGTLSRGTSKRAIALRADMDALPLQEKNSFAHKSKHDGKMHACGHDGHTAMLLGAAKYIADRGDFDGTVHFIFQPAEEGGGGGRVMVRDGLFSKFPCDGVYGMHNWPGMEAGTIGVRAGPMLASADFFRITVTGTGGHGAMPHLANDPVVVGAEMVTALQTIASRSADPVEAVVVSVTQFHAGTAGNVIPDEAKLSGTCRTLSSEARDLVEERVRRIVKGVAEAHGVKADVGYHRGYPVLVNSVEETERARMAAATVVGADNVVVDPPPEMGAEDFAYMLQAKPGSYVWLGNGGAAGGCLLHNPNYDFNDDVAPIGASYWVSLVEQELAAK
ncbi:MAG: M20 family metallopeptidase [Alphaproteobacteria bacterium]|nr:M20 family metallopeptidase [Alphaproteobacteria bacterium]